MKIFKILAIYVMEHQHFRESVKQLKYKKDKLNFFKYVNHQKRDC